MTILVHRDGRKTTVTSVLTRVRQTETEGGGCGPEAETGKVATGSQKKRGRRSLLELLSRVRPVRLRLQIADLRTPAGVFEATEVIGHLCSLRN